MASWERDTGQLDMPDPNAGDEAAYVEAWEGRVIEPALFDGPHIANPMPAGMSPVCACGWTPWGGFSMADHLRDMGAFVDGVE